MVHLNEILNKFPCYQETHKQQITWDIHSFKAKFLTNILFYQSKEYPLNIDEKYIHFFYHLKNKILLRDDQIAEKESLLLEEDPIDNNKNIEKIELKKEDLIDMWKRSMKLMVEDILQSDDLNDKNNNNNNNNMILPVYQRINRSNNVRVEKNNNIKITFDCWKIKTPSSQQLNDENYPTRLFSLFSYFNFYYQMKRFKKMNELYLQSNEIISLPYDLYIPSFRLKKLSLYNNLIQSIEKLPISALKNLIHLELNKNKIDRALICNLPLLESIDLSSNFLSHFAVHIHQFNTHKNHNINNDNNK